MVPVIKPKKDMTELDLQTMAAFANELADAARVVILPYWRKPIEVESKLENDRPVAESPVTEADR
jgi:fructose-1,6-bisphosphatase/inositol monophosphatase family enzyme